MPITSIALGILGAGKSLGFQVRFRVQGVGAGGWGWGLGVGRLGLGIGFRFGGSGLGLWFRGGLQSLEHLQV